jgi:hypothetical protein
MKESPKFPDMKHVPWSEEDARRNKYLNTVEGIFSPDEEVVMTEKLDGCLYYHEGVRTKENGVVPIGKIVNQELDVEVLCMNPETQELEYKTVTNYFINGRTEDWLKISLEQVAESDRLIVTPNHEIYTREGKKLAKDIEEGDQILTRLPDIEGELKELLIGSLLGDASAKKTSANYHLSETHGENQHDYAEWKIDKLKQAEVFGGDYKEKSRFDENHRETEKLAFYTKAMPSVSRLVEPFLSEESKEVPEDLELTKKSIAIWYCDDGHIHKSDSQRPRVSFSTNGFTEESVGILQRELQKFNIESRRKDYGKGYRLEIGADDSELLFDIINNYVPPCMERKLPEAYRTEAEVWSIERGNGCNSEVLDVEDYTPPNQKRKFDIEVADNHNYFVKDFLVSNSNSCLTKEKVFARTHSAEPRHESFDYLKARHAEELAEKIPENIAIYGEYLHAKHSIKYTELPGYFVVFAVLNMEEEVWYSWEKTKEIANLHGLPHAPEIKKGHFHERTFKDEPEGESEYGDTREGYVLRNTKEIPVGEYVENAAKCVRHGHVQTEERHWRKGGSYEENELAEGVDK